MPRTVQRIGFGFLLGLIFAEGVSAIELQPGDLVIADSSSSGSVFIVSAGQLAAVLPQEFVKPTGVALTATEIVVLDKNLSNNPPAVYWIDPSTELTNSRCEKSGPLTAVTATPEGEVFVGRGLGEDFKIFRVRPDDPCSWQVVSYNGQILRDADDLAYDGDGHLYAIESFGVGPPTRRVARVVAIEISSGEQSIVSEGGFLHTPTGLSISPDGSIIVSDDGIDSPARIVRIQPTTGTQELLFEGGFFFLNGVAVTPDNLILALDLLDAIAIGMDGSNQGTVYSQPNGAYFEDIAVVPTACFDNVDNDGDGATDSNDIGCRDASSDTESPQCQDGINNDPGQDPDPGLIDFDGGLSALGYVATDPDPDCQTPWRDCEGFACRTGGCGLGGFELALILPGLMWLHRRRRRLH